MSVLHRDPRHAAVLCESNFLGQITSITRIFKPSLYILALEPSLFKLPGSHRLTQRPHGEDRLSLKTHGMGFPGDAGGKKPACQCRSHRRHRFDPWVWKIPWRRAWKPTPVFWSGESHGQRSLEGYNPWGFKGSDTTEVTECAHVCSVCQTAAAPPHQTSSM